MMNGMTFGYCYPGTGFEVTMTINEDFCLEEIADAFKVFLIAAGFSPNEVIITYGDDESV